MENCAKIEATEPETVCHYNTKGLYHRIDGPAVEWYDGSKSWYKHGLRHRSDGPAIITAEGIKKWYINGKLHRLNGPAVKYPNWKNFWFINGVDFSKSQHNRLCLFSILEPRRIDLRSTEDND